MKYTAVLFLMLLSGCASKDYVVYVEAQKSLSRDATVTEAARLSTILEMTKSADPTVRAVGLMLLQQNQNKNINIEPPTKNWLGL